MFNSSVIGVTCKAGLCDCVYMHQGPFVMIDKLVDHMLNLQMPDGETFRSNRLLSVLAVSVSINA